MFMSLLSSPYYIIEYCYLQYKLLDSVDHVVLIT